MRTARREDRAVWNARRKGGKMRKIIMILTGLFLTAGVLVTGTYGLSQEDLAIYRQAAELKERGGDMGFAGFSFTDYPVAFYDGDRDYVVTREGEDYRVTKRRAVIHFMAATAWPVDGHYEVLVPTVQKMSSLLNLMSMGDMEYGAEEQAATLWHEAFHCFQMTYYRDNIEKICLSEIDEGIIAGEADTNLRAVSLLEEQSRLLEEAVKTRDVDRIRESIVQYRELDQERKALLSREAAAVEDYYTRVEGTARYVEACVYKMLVPERFDSAYLDGISECGGGSEKYYRMGMAQCMILDRIAPDWKRGFDFSESLLDLIYARLDI